MSKKITYKEIKKNWQEIRDEAEPFTAEIVLEKMDLFLKQQEKRDEKVDNFFGIIKELLKLRREDEEEKYARTAQEAYKITRLRLELENVLDIIVEGFTKESKNE